MVKLPNPNDNGLVSLVYVNMVTEGKLSSNICAKTIEWRKTNGAYHDEMHHSIALLNRTSTREKSFY